jgi:hypothetical protein
MENTSSGKYGSSDADCFASFLARLLEFGFNEEIASRFMAVEERGLVMVQRFIEYDK